MSDKKKVYSAGIVTAYGAAVRSGYSGTFEQFSEAMAALPILVENLENMTVEVNVIAHDAQPSGTYTDGTLTLNIPQGERGETGKSAYQYAVEGGYPGTEAEFEQLCAELGIEVGHLENMTVVVTQVASSVAPSGTYVDGTLTITVPAATDAQVSSAVGTWLDENVDPTTGYVLDRTLTQENAAAPADLVGDLKESFTQEVGGGSVILHATDSEPYAGYWIQNAISHKMALAPSTSYCTIENPIDISSLKVGSDVSMMASVTSAYGVFIYNSNGYALDYVNGNNAEEKGYEVNSNPQLITLKVPDGAKYIVSDIRNTKYTDMSIFDVYCTSTSQIDYLHEDVDNLIETKGIQVDTLTTTWTHNAYVFKNNTIITTGEDTFCASEYFNIKPYSSLEIPWDFSGSGASMCFVSEDRNTVIAYYQAANLDESPAAINVPDGAAWFRTTQRTTKIDGFSIKATLKYIDYVRDMTSAVYAPEQPLDKIIHDGGFCKILNTIGVVGDSLASGSMHRPEAQTSGEDEEVVDLVWYSWIQQIARYSGLTAFNFSMGGLSARSLRYGTTNPNIQQILTNLNDSNKKCKAYFVALGHNDANYMESHPEEYDVGSISDCNLADPSLNADSYYGNLAWIISLLKTVQPRAKIFLVTMKVASRFGALNVAVRDMVNLFNTYYSNTDVYLIDMEGVTIETSWEYYEGHGSPQGYLNYSYQISSYVDYIIRHNQNDFKTVAYIGTQYLT